MINQLNNLNHIAIIPDGNRRWAKNRGLPVIEGHRKGLDVTLKLLKKVKELGIAVLTVWGFSTENWGREKKEVHLLMRLFEEGIKKYLNELIKNKIRFIHIGKKDRFSKNLKSILLKTEDKTKKFNQYYFVLALDYGGRDEVLRAMQQIRSLIPKQTKFVSDKKLKAQSLSVKDFEKFLDTKDLPYSCPDLVIRTGGEMRISGFMLWQTAYSEWIFIKKYFPDFTPDDLENCIQEYTKRKRRFGK